MDVKHTYYAADTENNVPKSDLYEDLTENDYDELLSSTTPYESPDPLFTDERDSDTRIWAAAIGPVKEDCCPDDVDVYSTTSEFLAHCKYKLGYSPVVYFHNAAYDLPLILTALIRLGYKESMNGRGITPDEEKTIGELETALIDLRAENEEILNTIKAIENNATGKLSKDERAQINSLWNTLAEEDCNKTYVSEIVSMKAEIEERKHKMQPNDKEFLPLISGDGMWYSLKVRFPKNHKCVEFRDSLKLLPFKVEVIAKQLKTKAQKLVGEIDYTIQRDADHRITESEEKYIKNDVLIMMEALAKIEPLGMLEKLTIGSHCMRDFKERLGNGNFKSGNDIFELLFPALSYELDSVLRKSYHGGWCYNNTYGDIKDQRNSIDKIEVYDVNSLYPSVMYNHNYPTGQPNHFNGNEFEKYSNELYIIRCQVQFVIKPNHLPFIQIKNSRWKDNEYIKDSEGIIEMVFTKPDFELLQEQYEVLYLDILEGWWFEGSKTIFNDYIDHWYSMKKNAPNKVIRLVAKLHLNNLYGKFATAIKRASAHPYLDEKGVLAFHREDEITRGGYIPVGSFCTSYARGVTIRAAQKNYVRFLYSDTDSIHLLGEATDIAVGMELGEWAHETTADMGRFVRQKTYIEHTVAEDEQPCAPYWNIKACGAPASTKTRLLYKVTEDVKTVDGYKTVFRRLEYDENDNIVSPKRSDEEILERFTYGLVEAGKLSKKRVKGGSILFETTFKINL